MCLKKNISSSLEAPHAHMAQSSQAKLSSFSSAYIHHPQTSIASPNLPIRNFSTISPTSCSLQQTWRKEMWHCLFWYVPHHHRKLLFTWKMSQEETLNKQTEEFLPQTSESNPRHHFEKSTIVLQIPIQSPWKHINTVNMQTAPLLLRENKL